MAEPVRTKEGGIFHLSANPNTSRMANSDYKID